MAIKRGGACEEEQDCQIAGFQVKIASSPPTGCKATGGSQWQATEVAAICHIHASCDRSVAIADQGFR
jgi:hypothetical protein